MEWVIDGAKYLHSIGWPWWLVAIAGFWVLLLWGVKRLVGVAGTGLDKLREHYQEVITELRVRNERLRTERDDAEGRLVTLSKELLTEREARIALERRLRRLQDENDAL